MYVKAVTRSWQASRERSLEYARREPTTQVLYQIIYEYREEFEFCWSERFEQTYGYLRNDIPRAFDRFLDCGILLHGCARAVCTDCNHSRLIAFSCKQRYICPSCDAKRALFFGEHLHENVLLPYPNVHQVFSIPKLLRPRLKFNRKLLSLLYRAAWNAWSELIGDALPDCKPASVTALHSFGDLLHWHPHVHGLALYGGIDSSDNFQELPTVDTDYLTTCFARNFMQALLDAGEIEQETIDLINSWEYSGFHVYVGEPVSAEDADARLFLGRYLKKSAIANNRLEIIHESGSPKVRIHKHTDDQEIVRDLKPLEFLAELSQHVAPPRAQTVRYFGEYSKRTRGAKRLALDTSGPLPDIEPAPKPNTSWARAIARVYEVDPLECPRCGGSMKIKSFIHSPTEIKKIAQNLGIQAWRAPPKISSEQAN